MSFYIFFDGDCGFCNQSIMFFVRRLSQASLDRVKVAPLSGETAAQHLLHGKTVPDSLVVIDNGRIYFKLSAVFRIFTQCRGLWKLLSIFQFLPASPFDFIYDIIARRRNKMKVRCSVPAPQYRALFLP